MKYIVEHLEDDIHEWSILEYQHMLENVGHENLVICNLREEWICILSNKLVGAILTTKSVKDYVEGKKTILLDQCAESCLLPSDSHDFQYIIVGGILGTDEFDGPMVDRTSAVRCTEFTSRHLGEKQMTADTAVIVAKRIVENQVCLSDIKFIDKPSIKIRKKEWVEMPFRYLPSDMNNSNEPLLPKGMLEHLKQTM